MVECRAADGDESTTCRLFLLVQLHVVLCTSHVCTLGLLVLGKQMI